MCFSTTATHRVITMTVADGKVPYRAVVRAQTTERLGEKAAIVVFSSEGGIYVSAQVAYDKDLY